MATTTIGTNGRQRADIGLWEVNEGSDAGSQTGACYNDSPFDETVVIDSATPDDTTLTVAVGERHDGLAGSGARIVRTASIGVKLVTLGATNVDKTLSWLELDLSGSSQKTQQGYFSGFHSGAVFKFDHLICHGAASYTVQATGYTSIFGQAGTFVANCIFYDTGENYTGGSGDKSCLAFAGGVGKFYNCTVHDTYTNASSGNAICVKGSDVAGFAARNIIATDPTGNAPVCFSPADEGYGTALVSHNLSSDATAPDDSDPGTALHSKAAADQYTSTSPVDLRLKDAAADAYEAGTDLEETPTGVNIDIQGFDRHAEAVDWSMGADQGQFAPGGETHDMAVQSDTAALSDTIIRVADAFRQVSDTAALSDSVTRQADLFRLIADVLTASDTAVAVAGEVRNMAVQSDTAALADTITRIADIFRTTTDTLATTDATTRTADVFRVVSDALAASDAVARQADAFRQIIDALTLADSLTANVTGLALREIADTLAVSDSTSRVADIFRALSDTIAVADSVDAAQLPSGNWERTVIDTLATSDSVARVADLFRSIAADTLSLSDTTTIQALVGGNWERLISEALALSDSISAGKVARLALTDTLAATDAITRQPIIARTIADALAMSDAALRRYIARRLLTSALVASDSVTRRVSIFRDLSDALAMSDAVSRRIAFDRPLSDTLALSDNITASALQIIARTLSDTLGLSDATSRTSTANRGLSDSTVLTDTVLERTIARRGLSDALAMSDSIPPLIMLVARLLSDTLDLSDAVQREAILHVLASDTIALGDDVSRQVDVLRAIIDRLRLADDAEHQPTGPYRFGAKQIYAPGAVAAQTKGFP